MNKDSCDSNDCENNATSVDGIGTQKSLYPDGYAGKNCEKGTQDAKLRCERARVEASPSASAFPYTSYSHTDSNLSKRSVSQVAPGPVYFPQAVADLYPGTAVQVIVAEDHSFNLNEPALEKILLDPRVKDSKVIVLSIAGAFRTGKSFLLNFFLRYLHARGSKNWIGNPNAPLKGFDWRGGIDRNTTGIVMWSEPYMVELPGGEKAFVLLMDTQGTFDNQSTVKDCATVFALSTMLSSVQVYNVTSKIQENDLQHLQFFTEYGRMTLEGSESKPFQDLHFLVRDWKFPYQYQYGWKGGEEYLAKCLQETAVLPQEMLQLRRHLRSCFAKIGCCLMPHPGDEVATDKDFDGRISNIKDNFRGRVEEFISTLLSQENLVVKEVNGTKITGKELFEYFKTYINIYQGNELPEPKSIFEATAEANNLAAVRKAMDLYIKHMEKVCGRDESNIDPETLMREHNNGRNDAVQLFQKTRKMGGEKKSRVFQDQLERQIIESYANDYLYNSAFRATSEWNHLAAISKAMYLYKKHMELVCGDNKAYVAPETLKREHDNGRQKAVQLFQSTRKMGGVEKSRVFQEQLELQFKESFTNYDHLNCARLTTAELKHLTAVGQAVNLYRKRMELLCGGNEAYVDPETLKQEHDRCRQEAVDYFQGICKMGGDEMKRIFQEQLEQQIIDSYANYCRFNSAFLATAEWKHLVAVSKAMAHYTKRMELLCKGNEVYVDPETLKQEHGRCRQEAFELFQSAPKMGGEAKSRVFQDQLEQQINESYAKYDRLNSALLETAEANSVAAVNKAKGFYKKSMERVCGFDKPCLDPEPLKREHERCQQEAVEHFQSNQKMIGEEKSRSFQEELEQQIKESFTTYDRHNSTLVETAGAAVSKAVAHYKRHMDLGCGGKKPCLDPEPLKQLHERCRKDAVEHFQSICKMIGDEKSRAFQEQLELLLKESFTNYDRLNSARLKNAEDAVGTAMVDYKKHMELVCGGDKPYLDPKTLKKKSKHYQQQALQLFLSTCKMIAEGRILAIQGQLEQQIMESCTNFAAHNETKKRRCIIQ